MKSRPPMIHVVVLALLTTLIVAARVHLADEPPEQDIATYSVIGHEITHGKRLYSDVWDMKPPAIFATYAVADFIAGRDVRAQSCMLSVFTSLATMLLLYRCGGLAAAILWSAVCINPAFQAHMPNTESFINVTVAGAMVLLLARSPLNARSAIVLGLLLGVGSLYKHVLIVPAVMLLAAHIAVPAGITRRSAIVQSLIVIAAMFACWMLVFLYFAMTGRGVLLWQTVFVYPRYYAGSIGENLLALFSPKHLFPDFLADAGPLLALAVLGIILLIAKGRRRPAALITALLLGSYIALALPGQFFAHYYQLLLVPAVLAAGYTTIALPRFGMALPIVAALGMAALQSGQFAGDTNARTRKHLSDWVADSAQLAPLIESRLKPDESFFVWGDETELYALTRRSPPAVMLWKSHAENGPMAQWLTERTVADLKRNPPALIVVWTLGGWPDSHNDIWYWINDHYDRSDSIGRGLFGLMVPKAKSGQ